MVVRRTRNEEFADLPARRWHLHPLFPPPPPIPCPSSVLSVEKRGLDRPPSTRPRKSSSGETTRWLCPLLRTSGPLEVLCRPIARDTWTPLGLSPSSPPPRGHPKGILDLASIARRGDSVNTVTSSLSLSLSLVTTVRFEDGYDASSSSHKFSYRIFFSSNRVEYRHLAFRLKKVLAHSHRLDKIFNNYMNLETITLRRNYQSVRTSTWCLNIFPIYRTGRH